jgi:hypothetical protein
MNFLQYFLYIVVLTLANTMQINAMQTPTKYPMLALAKNLLPRQDKTITLVCAQEGTELTNVPISLLSDCNVSGFFAKLIADSGNQIDTISQIIVPDIDDATLRSIIYFMVIAQGLLSDSGLEHDRAYRVTKNRITECLSPYRNQPEIIQYYAQVAQYLQFDLLSKAIEQLSERER